MSVVTTTFDRILGSWVEIPSVAAQLGTCVQMGFIQMLVPLLSHAAGPHHETNYAFLASLIQERTAPFVYLRSILPQFVLC